MKQHTKLSNGLNIITDNLPEMQSVVGGFWCNTGSRYETADNNGIAHFFEHMLFQGTPTRNAQQIKEEMEDMGANINAYTSYDVTAYYYHILKDDLAKSFDVFSDMIQNSVFPEKELETERGAVLQEIAMYEDMPDSVVDELAQASAYKDQPLGRPILGPPENVKSFSQADLNAYKDSLMNPANLVISLSGNVDHKNVVTMAEDYFGDLTPGDKNNPEQAHYIGGDVYQEKDIEQAQIMLQLEGQPLKKDDNHVLPIFSIILGGGMSSRLFQEVREKRGLVYGVHSFAKSYSDTGIFTIYAGTSPEKVNETIQICCDELVKATETITEQELKRAKAQIKASLIFAQEKLMSRAARQARRMIFFNDLPDYDSLMQRIESVTLEEVKEAGRSILTSRLSRTVLGKVDGLDPYRESLAA